jgi:O-antigen/teichoic acid export membrane protein
MIEENKSYRQIIKATSIFGGVQVFNIIISILRSKFIALLLGPAGMGIVGLLNSTTGLIGALTNFGLGTSAVRDVASAYGTGEIKRIATIVTIFKRWVWVTGTLGTLVMLVFSPMLSQLTFGNDSYTFAYVWISVTLLFTQLSSGQLVILQGMRKLHYLAKASLTGSALGLIVTLPLYYRFGIDGIVPSVIFSSIISLSLSWYFAKKVKIEIVKVSFSSFFSEGKNMLIMGFIISFSGLITLGTSYVMRIYISHIGGVEQVGLYTAGFAIISTYVGMVFSAMGTDYYPRLAGVVDNVELCRRTINQQAEVAILILSPILMIFLVFINGVIILLYSDKFVLISEMIQWAALGMLFKAGSWAIGYIFLAKGASKLFFFNDLFSNAYMLAINILGYGIWGLTGLGFSFMIGYFFHLVQMIIVSKIIYNFTFNFSFVRIFLVQLVLAISCFIVVRILDSPYTYAVGSVLIIISTLFSFKELDRRLNIKQLLSKIKKS